MQEVLLAYFDYLKHSLTRCSNTKNIELCLTLSLQVLYNSPNKYQSFRHTHLTRRTF